MRDIALARLHRWPRALPAPVDRGLGRPGAAGPRRPGCRVTAEATPHHFTLTDECCASYDAVFKVNPPLRTDADVAAVRAGLADGTHRRHRHRPRAAPGAREGAAVRPGAPGHARASRPRSRSRSPSSTCRSSGCSRCCRGSRRRSPTSTTATAARRRRAPRQPLRHRPDVTWIVRGDAMASQVAQHPVRGSRRCAAGCATRSFTANPWRRRRGPEMTRPAMSLRIREGAVGARRRHDVRRRGDRRRAGRRRSPPARSCSTRCCRATKR